MIDRAVEEARRRGSHVDFLLADVLDHDLGSDQYDLAVFLGNALSDFPVDDSFELARRVRRSLCRHGRFAVHYLDGFFPFVQETYLREGIEQEEPARATRRFKAYDARSGSFAETYGNEATGQSVDYASYLYTAPFVRSLFGQLFPLESFVALSERSYLDISRKKWGQVSAYHLRTSPALTERMGRRRVCWSHLGALPPGMYFDGGSWVVETYAGANAYSGSPRRMRT